MRGSRPAAPIASRSTTMAAWCGRRRPNGTKVEFDTDPETSGWQRFVIDVMGLLPIEEQL